MPVSNQKAPFKKSPEFQRDSFLRTPDWRWQQARQINLAELTKKEYAPDVDKLVLYAARLQAAMVNPASRQFLQKKMPDAWHVVKLGEMDNASQLKAQLQACIIYGLQPKQIADKLKWLTPVQARLYMDLFCDLSGVQGISAWFEQLMLQPARQGRSMNLVRARALAHYHSLQAALHSLRFGNSGKSAKEAMDLMWRDARNKGIFDYIAQSINVPIQMYIQSMQQAIKSRQDQAFMLSNKQGNTQSEVLLQASNKIASSVRGFTQAQIKLSTQAQKAGIDSSVTFVNHIINSKTEKV